ncbi:MAG: transcriptional regulator with AAA-type ATPase domain/HAMP domain-containing protein [Planctomycetota bacterium]|jgi:transcriptional regulator with AAA-type ATPase domain/HAMP domain-containing protein
MCEQVHPLRLLTSALAWLALMARIIAHMLLAALLCVTSLAQAKVSSPIELAIATFAPTVDGDLAEWKSLKKLRFGRDQVFRGAGSWRGNKDLSASFLVSWDNNRLYLAGTILDDQIVGDEVVTPDQIDCLELHIGSSTLDPGSRAERSVLRLFPLRAHRPWVWGGSEQGVAEDSLQPITQLAGIEVFGRRLNAGSYVFEAAIPFHHFPNLKPGTQTLGFDLVLRDFDAGSGAEATAMSWSKTDPFDGPRAGVLSLGAPGLMAPVSVPAPLLSSELLVDLPYLLVPLLSLVALILLLRGWARIRGRVRWLRTALVVFGVAAFLIGLWLPTLMTSFRAEEQRERLQAGLASLQGAMPLLEAGSLGSYRGASRDRAVVDLVSGRPVERQRYAQYRSLVEIAPDQFGPPVRSFDDLPVRCYWLPLPSERAASFQFDPPLRGRKLNLVLGRPYAPSIALIDPRPVTILDVEIDIDGEKQHKVIDLDLPFDDATSLGRDFWEARVVPIDLGEEVRTLAELRSLTIGCTGNPDMRLVGISLEGEQQGSIEPLSLGEPSRDGVLTDLRGPYPLDAGIELAPSAVAKVTIPEGQDSPEDLWLFYRASYPGLPTANPGAPVAEVVLHFADGRQKQSIIFEHQVSMFYELAVHNTRDDPPPESQASFAMTWVDESQERHINLGYPVKELPQDTALQAIEFRNLADYRVRFRSVVFVKEAAIAPQDPPDSPLVREGNFRRLPAQPELEDVVISIYRTGELSESTLTLAERQDVLTLPRAVGSAEVTETVSLLPTGGRRLSMFAPLGGDGWDGAVLAVSWTDEMWAASGQFANRLGLLLCLLSMPFLLVLLSELLAVVTNLRFRLMTVMSVASLAPLGLLSLVLVQVLESGHTTEVEDDTSSTVKSAMLQLEDEKSGVKESAQQWLRDLATLANEKLVEGEAPIPVETVDAVAEELDGLLAGQLPPEWRGGFLRLEWQPPNASLDPVVLVAGDDRMHQAEAPARLEPGLFMQWGRLMLGVRAEQAVSGGTLSLTAGRPLNGSVLRALAPGHDLLLTDVRGYPLAATEGRDSAERLLQQAYDPSTMLAREAALVTGDETRQPVILRESAAMGDYVIGAEVLRDLQETPRGLLVVATPDERATLDLAIGRIPVRAFFWLVAGSLIVLAAFLSFVVSGRISRPIERLEKGALALSRGVFETRVPADEGGQVGQLTRAFNQMAVDLHSRMQDLQALNRTMADLAAEHDEGTAIEVLRRFCANQTGADAVVTTMLDDSGTALVLHAGGEAVGERIGLNGWSILSLAGPFCCRSRQGRLPAPWGEALPQCGALLGLPIVFAGQTRGVVLLGFDLDEPSPVDLELLTTVVAQAASACERSQLQRLAVQDPVTGAFAPDYFRRRVVDQVSQAQYLEQPFSLLAFRVSERNRSAHRLQQFVHLLRECLPDAAVVGHGGRGRFYVGLPQSDRQDAEVMRQDVTAAWRAKGRQDGIEAGGATFGSALSVFPGEAASAEFLFDAVRTQLESDPVREAVEAESDVSLLQAGVTAVSAAMRPVYSTLRRVAPTDLPILLEGETGVGKEVLTNLVHRWSRRSKGPLIKVHCAALSETLLASELFGHERGAFTGADRRKTGRFEQADGGTLFLDEVGELPHDVQVALLRALQEGEIDRVGGTESVKVDVRVIAATNRDMQQMVKDGRFREDLYYRLQGMVVVVPPLRERREELLGLVQLFVREIVLTGHAPERELSTDAMDELYGQEWPGNIRQLRTTIFRALLLARGAVVRQHDVRSALAGGSTLALPESSVAVVDEAPGAASDAVVAKRDAPLTPGRDRSLGRGVDSGGIGGESSRDAVSRVSGRERRLPVPDPVASEPIVYLVRPDSELEAGPIADSVTGPILTPKSRVIGLPDSEVASGKSADVPLTPRLLQLLSLIQERGRITTQDHMTSSGVSHRTALRDLQALVQHGVVERVGARRGAFYRSSGTAANSIEPDSTTDH